MNGAISLNLHRHHLPSVRMGILSLLVLFLATSFLGVMAMIIAFPSQMAQEPAAIAGDIRDLSVAIGLVFGKPVQLGNTDRVRFDTAVNGVGNYAEYSSITPFKVNGIAAGQPFMLNGTYYHSHMVAPESTEDKIESSSPVFLTFSDMNGIKVTVNAPSENGLTSYIPVQQIELRNGSAVVHCGTSAGYRDFTVPEDEIRQALSKYRDIDGPIFNPYTGSPDEYFKRGLWASYSGNTLKSLYIYDGIVWSQ